MATSKTDLLNMASMRYGGVKITSPNDDSQDARDLMLVYDETLDEILAEGIWTFAQKRALLTILADVTIPFTDDGVDVVYGQPSDIIRVNFASSPAATIKLENIGGVNVILSDTNNLGIQYTYRNQDPSTYYAMFKRAFATLLAARVCFTRTESVKKAELLLKQYQDVDLPKALATDAMQSSPVQPMQSEWEQARFIAGTGIVGRPGDQSWHPIW